MKKRNHLFKNIFCYLTLPLSDELVEVANRGRDLVSDRLVVGEDGEQRLGHVLVRLLVVFALENEDELVREAHRREGGLQLRVLLAHRRHEKASL